MNDSSMSCAEPMKLCFKCEERKPRSNFYQHAQMADGLLGKCKSCTKHDVKIGRNDKTRAYDRRRYRERTHEHKARMAVNVAIANGSIVRPPGCWYCGLACEPEAHHADYKNPLGVVFLCRSCHMECHKVTTAMKMGNEYAMKLGELIRSEWAND